MFFKAKAQQSLCSPLALLLAFLERILRRGVWRTTVLLWLGTIVVVKTGSRHREDDIIHPVGDIIFFPAAEGTTQCAVVPTTVAF